MYAIPCKLCGWSEAMHDGGLSAGEENDPQYTEKRPGYEMPLLNAKGEFYDGHGYVCSDPKFHRKAVDLEKLGVDPFYLDVGLQESHRKYFDIILNHYDKSRQ